MRYTAWYGKPWKQKKRVTLGLVIVGKKGYFPFSLQIGLSKKKKSLCLVTPSSVSVVNNKLNS